MNTLIGTDDLIPEGYKADANGNLHADSTMDEFMKKYLAEFRPLAYYDKATDSIRVRLVDTSVTEVRLNQYLAILRSNHGRADAAVGFDITEVHQLFHRLGLKSAGVFELTDLVDRIVEVLPCEASLQIKQAFRPVLCEEKFEVEIEV